MHCRRTTYGVDHCGEACPDGGDASKPVWFLSLDAKRTIQHAVAISRLRFKEDSVEHYVMTVRTYNVTETFKTYRRQVEMCKHFQVSA